MRWDLEWFYFSTIETLIEGTCGYRQLIDDLTQLDCERLRVHLAPEQRATNGEPPLIELIRPIPGRLGSKHVWTKDWPERLTVLIRRLPEPFREEILVMPEALIFPWPFPVRDGNLKIQLENKLSGCGITNRDFPHLDNTEFDEKKGIRLRSVFTTLDLLLKDKDSPHRGGLEDNDNDMRQNAIRNYEACLKNEAKEWTDFILAEQLMITSLGNNSTESTRLISEDAQNLSLTVGLEVPDASIYGPTFSPHPFGALGRCLDIDLAPAWVGVSPPRTNC